MTTATIKAIETRYKGCRFRSRLEARWAVFLDALGVEWEYERQGYVVDGTPYLPDFWIPYKRGPKGSGFHLEIKPLEYDQSDCNLCRKLAVQTGNSTYLIAGQPWPGLHTSFAYSHTQDGREQKERTLGEIGVHTFGFYYLGECEAAPDHLFCGSQIGPFRDFTSPFDSGEFDEPPGEKARRLRAAFINARSARFEHGECGA